MIVAPTGAVFSLSASRFAVVTTATRHASLNSIADELGPFLLRAHTRLIEVGEEASNYAHQIILGSRAVSASARGVAVWKESSTRSGGFVHG